MPDNCKNFSDTFNYTPKALLVKQIGREPQQEKPPKPHPLLLAYHFRDLLDTGVVNNRAELARRLGLSRARIAQIMNLLELPVEIREQILRLPEEKQRRFTERHLRQLLEPRSSRR